MLIQALRGLKTLHLRMEASQKSAMTIATFLESHSAVLKVRLRNIHTLLSNNACHLIYERHIIILERNEIVFKEVFIN